MIFTKGAHQSSKFQTFDCSGEISPNLYFDSLLLLKVCKVSAKTLWRSYVSWYQRVVQNLKKNWFFVSKMTRIWWILIWALKSLKNLHFDWFLLCKVYNVWPKTSTEELYFMTLKSHATFEEKLTCGLVMTWRIWQIFIRTLERVKTGTFMGSFCLK